MITQFSSCTHGKCSIKYVQIFGMEVLVTVRSILLVTRHSCSKISIVKLMKKGRYYVPHDKYLLKANHTLVPGRKKKKKKVGRGVSSINLNN